MNALVDDIEKNTLKRLQENLDDLRKALGDSEREFEDVEKKVNTFRAELKNAVDKSCDNVVEELKQIESKQNEEIRSIISDLEDQIQQNESFISICSETIRKGGLQVLKYSPHIPTPRVRSVDSLSQNGPVFCPIIALLEMIKKGIGEIKTNLSLTTDMLELTSKQTLADKPGTSTNTVPSIKVELICKFRYKYGASHVCPVGPNKAWIAEWFDNVLRLYDDKGEELKSIDIGKSLRCVAARSSGDAIVCYGNQIRIVTMDGKVRTLIDTSPFHPDVVCLTEKEEIVVSMVGQRVKNHVAVYTPDGKRKIPEIKCQDQQWTDRMTQSSLVPYIRPR